MLFPNSPLWYSKLDLNRAVFQNLMCGISSRCARASPQPCTNVQTHRVHQYEREGSQLLNGNDDGKTGGEWISTANKAEPNSGTCWDGQSGVNLVCNKHRRMLPIHDRRTLDCSQMVGNSDGHTAVMRLRLSFVPTVPGHARASRSAAVIAIAGMRQAIIGFANTRAATE